tara:strand:+ start:143 stop:259 length:117 start_codon:yes stop_codon:yes gene_type:complete
LSDEELINGARKKEDMIKMKDEIIITGTEIWATVTPSP